LPWSTANEDLVELFETTGQVELAEILFDGTRSKGCGVVQFAQTAEAETAIGMSSASPLLSRTHSLFLQPNSSNTCMEADPWVRWTILLMSAILLNSLFLIDVRFNDRWHTFTPTAAKGGQVGPMQAEGLWFTYTPYTRSDTIITTCPACLFISTPHVVHDT
jgi:RNA recognition motif. (a.k.a. RRM, RBD, or RNP domain)